MMTRNKLVIKLRYILSLCIIIGTFIAISTISLASGKLSGEFKTLTESVTAYESMNKDSEKTTIETGEMVLVTAQDSEWIHVMYKGEDLFIPAGDKSAIGDFDNEQASEEIEQRSQTDKSWIESYIAQMKAIRSARIWRIAIIVIIVAVITFIIISTIRHSSDKAEENTKE